MGRKTTLTIEGWSGKGKGSIDINVGGFMLVERNLGGRKIQKLVVNRKPDQYSSRFGMMAYLNKSNGTLAWGFNEMSLRVDDFDDQGRIVASTTYDFVSIGVADSRAVGGDEELTFVFNKKSEFAISNVVVAPQSN